MGKYRVVLHFLAVAAMIWLSSSCTEEDLPSGDGDFKIQNGDVTLAGNLVLPATKGPYPVVVIVPGSGRVDYRSARILFNELPAHGIAILSYDKRGVGQSTGTYEIVNAANSSEVFHDLAGDVIAWVEFLSIHKDINPGQIGLVGISQGGWIAPLAASMNNKVSFIVNTVGPTVTIGKESHYSFLTQEKQALPDGTINGFSIDALNEFAANFKGFQGFDPRPSIESLTIPGMWIFSEWDESIPTSLCVEILEEIKQTNNRDFTIRILPKANHQLNDVTTGQSIEFVTDEGGVVDWIKGVLSTG